MGKLRYTLQLLYISGEYLPEFQSSQHLYATVRIHLAGNRLGAYLLWNLSEATACNDTDPTPSPQTPVRDRPDPGSRRRDGQQSARNRRRNPRPRSRHRRGSLGSGRRSRQRREKTRVPERDEEEDNLQQYRVTVYWLKKPVKDGRPSRLQWRWPVGRAC